MKKLQDWKLTAFHNRIETHAGENAHISLRIHAMAVYTGTNALIPFCHGVNLFSIPWKVEAMSANARFRSLDKSMKSEICQIVKSRVVCTGTGDGMQ